MELSTRTDESTLQVLNINLPHARGKLNSLFHSLFSFTRFISRQLLMIFFVIWCVPYLFDFGSNEIGCKIHQTRTGMSCINLQTNNNHLQFNQDYSNSMLHIVSLMEKVEATKL